MSNKYNSFNNKDVPTDILNKVLGILDDVESSCDDTYYWPQDKWTKENIEQLSDILLDSANDIKETVKEVK